MGRVLNREKFDVEFLYEIADNFFLKLRVTGTVTPWLPEVKATMGDPGSPAEGREIDIENIAGVGANLPQRQQEQLKNDERFVAAVGEAVEKSI